MAASPHHVSEGQALALALLVADGNADAERRLVEVMRPLVRAQAARLHRRGTPMAGFDDLESVGLTAIVTAARRFDPDRGQARPWLLVRSRGAMLDLLRQAAPDTRRERRRRRRGDAARPARSRRPVPLPEPDGTDADDLASDRPSVGDAVTGSALVVDLVSSLDDDRERLLIVATVLRGRTLASVAMQLDMSLQWAADVRRRGLDRLRQRLDRQAA